MFWVIPWVCPNFQYTFNSPSEFTGVKAWCARCLPNCRPALLRRWPSWSGPVRRMPSGIITGDTVLMVATAAPAEARAARAADHGAAATVEATADTGAVTGAGVAARVARPAAIGAAAPVVPPVDIGAAARAVRPAATTVPAAVRAAAPAAAPTT